MRKRKFKRGAEVGALIGFCLAVLKSGGIANFFECVTKSMQGDTHGDYVFFVLGYVAVFSLLGGVVAVVKDTLGGKGSSRRLARPSGESKPH